MSQITPRHFVQSLMTSISYFPQALNYYSPTRDVEDIQRRQEKFAHFQSHVHRAEQHADTRGIMVDQFTSAAQWLNGTGMGLTEPQPFNIECNALVYKVGSVALRFQPSFVVREKYRHMLPDMWRFIDPSTQFTCEITPLPDMHNVTAADIIRLQQICEKDRFHYCDPLAENQGWYKTTFRHKPEPVITNPGALKRVQPV